MDDGGVRLQYVDASSSQRKRSRWAVFTSLRKLVKRVQLQGAQS
jgi:hypothetical protein